MNYDLLKTLYTPVITDDEGEVISGGEALDGFHLNTTEPLEGLDSYQFTPTVPRQVFAGTETYFYAFESETQAKELVPEAFPDETVDTE
jgi:hypothetical protein